MANQHMRILVVDDDFRLASSTAALLRSAGHQVNTLNDAAAAVAHLTQFDYDLALLDINMPGMSGFELLDSLQGKANNTVFIMMTGDTQLETAIEALRRGASDYIRKPFDPDELVIRINNALNANTLRTSHDRITAENRELELKLRQSQKMEAIGTLAGGIAHDFNNILSIVIGNTELAKAQLDRPQLASENLEKVLSATSRAKDLINQLLHFSRKDGEGWQSLELCSLIGDCLKLIRATIPSNIDIKQDAIDQTLYIKGDATQLHQVVINLCANAAHAMEDTGGTLEISLQTATISANQYPDVEPGDYVFLSVRDNGHGIPPDIKHQIFDPYFTTKTRGRGTGMGLAVVHGIVTNHGGYIDCVSEVGRGTEFRILLPITDLRSANLANETREDPAPGSERILLVDDEEMIVDVVSSMLHRLGYEVIAQTSSLTALELFQATPNDFDLLVTDLTMPQMGGDVLAGKIREIRADMPILICSGLDTSDHLSRSGSSDTFVFIHKPFALSELSESIRALLSKHQGERRRNPRFAPDNTAFVVFCSKPEVKCPLVDVSVTGLSITCEDSFPDPDALSIVSDDNNHILENIACKPVSKVPIGEDSRLVRLGINFEQLTFQQTQQLERYLAGESSQVH
ncbi:MAG: response regulator [Pseudomonadota bacterium]